MPKDKDIGGFRADMPADQRPGAAWAAHKAELAKDAAHKANLAQVAAYDRKEARLAKEATPQAVAFRRGRSTGFWLSMLTFAGGVIWFLIFYVIAKNSNEDKHNKYASGLAEGIAEALLAGVGIGVAVLALWLYYENSMSAPTRPAPAAVASTASKATTLDKLADETIDALPEIRFPIHIQLSARDIERPEFSDKDSDINSHVAFHLRHWKAYFEKHGDQRGLIGFEAWLRRAKELLASRSRLGVATIQDDFSETYLGRMEDKIKNRQKIFLEIDRAVETARQRREISSQRPAGQPSAGSSSRKITPEETEEQEKIAAKKKRDSEQADKDRQEQENLRIIYESQQNR